MSKFLESEEYGRAVITFPCGETVYLENVRMTALGECAFKLQAHSDVDDPLRSPIEVTNKLGDKMWIPSSWIYERK